MAEATFWDQEIKREVSARAQIYLAYYHPGPIASKEG